MKVVHDVSNSQGQHVGWAIFCPACQMTHMVNSSWTFNNDLEKPTFIPSLLVTNEDIRCHSFVTNGKIEFLNDCKHDLAGQTVELKQW